MQLGDVPTGHFRITRLLEVMFSNRLKVPVYYYSFSKTMNISFPNRQEWLWWPIPLGKLERFTDNSHCEDGGRQSRNRRNLQPNEQTSLCIPTRSRRKLVVRAKENLTIGFKEDNVISVFSSLGSLEFRTRLAWNCYSSLLRLIQFIMVTSCCVCTYGYCGTTVTRFVATFNTPKTSHRHPRRGQFLPSCPGRRKTALAKPVQWWQG